MVDYCIYVGWHWGSESRGKELRQSEKKKRKAKGQFIYVTKEAGEDRSGKVSGGEILEKRWRRERYVEKGRRKAESNRGKWEVVFC